MIWGCVSQVGDQSSNIGRYAVLAAGWPETIPGTTVNRACGSSQQALDFAVQAVMSGQQDVVVAGGVEVMSRVPLGSARATGMPYGPKVLARYDDFSFNQGLSAEMIAKKWGFSRTRLDEYSGQSHERAAAAQDGGAFTDQIVPVFADGRQRAGRHRRRGRAARDHRRETRPLKPAFAEDGVIHAGNSSQISDGAAALLVTTSEMALELGLDADRALSRGRGHRGGSGAHAHRPHPGDREGAAKGRRRAGRGGRLRGQRGLRAGAAGVAGRNRRGPGR